MYEGIRHQCGFSDCYCLNEKELRINLHTNLTVIYVKLVCEDPYICGTDTSLWDGEPREMLLSQELYNEKIYSVTVVPPFKRLQYYFIITFEDGSRRVLLEDGIHEMSVIERHDLARHFFKFGWMNESDICRTPQWVENTVWYQIFPDRFCRVDDGYQGCFRQWNEPVEPGYTTFYGGNIKGIESKLEYLSSLGITGIYFTPVFKSRTNHRYDTSDYETIDPVLGSNKDFAAMVKKAHSLGIKVMIDAVFNHSGREFFAWKDAMEKGEKSEYFDWYYINNSDTFAQEGKTDDGRYYSFAFVSEMPKLDTNNPKVAGYLTEVCRNWIRDFDVDGIRFDVGNEISHSFIRHLRTELKKEKDDLFLLGEIWTDSATYLDGDQYDSVMNYPFMQVVGNFFRNRELDACDFKYKINYCYSIYKQQVNRVLFNLLDSHDVTRLVNRAGSYDAFIQQLTVLMTMPGSPCIYYGTEIALEGENDPYNRRPMPWNDVESGKYQQITEEVKKLIKLRKSRWFESSRELAWGEAGSDRLIHYARGKEHKSHVYINANDYDVNLSAGGRIVFSRKYENGVLGQGGVLIFNMTD